MGFKTHLGILGRPYWGPKCPQRTAEVAAWLPKRASGDSAVTEQGGRLQPRAARECTGSGVQGACAREEWARLLPSGRGPQESEQ